MKLLRDVAISHLLTVEPAQSIRHLARIMTGRGVGAAVVVENEKVVGIVTERDVLHAVARDTDLATSDVDGIMTREVVSGAPGWDVKRAAKTMIEGGFRHLLVMEMDDPVGIVSLRDLMDSVIDEA